jgi:hypothetical protein
MRRRVFLQLCALPGLALFRPRAQPAPPPTYPGLTYTDSEGTPDLHSLADGNRATGVEYAA